MQLALVGSMAHDDPEGWEYYNQTVAYAAGDPDIFILSNLNNVGAVEVNAFQVHSAAVIQKSIKEGFGLTVSEALWKARPTVAGRVGGIVTQIEDGDRLARRLVGGVRGGLPRDAAPIPRRRASVRSRQGARAQAVPHAAPAARLARALQPARRATTTGRRARQVDRRVRSVGYRPAWRTPEADRRLEPRAGVVRARRRTASASRGAAAAAS